MASPKVSVIMSVYNDERFIHDAVESILRQTFQDFEFIIINDGSTDRTYEILSSFKDERIRVFNQENRGLTFSLNRCLSLARGEYIARMDGDDISMPERFSREISFLEEKPSIGLVGTFAYRIDTQGRKIGLSTYKTEPKEIRENLWIDCPFCHTSVMFRKSCIDKIGGYRERVGPAEDLDLWFRITEHFDGANIPEALHSFRIDPSGITLSRRFDQLRAGCLVRYLARQRLNSGKDNLDEWSEEELERTLEELFPKTPEREKIIYLNNLLYLAEVFYVTGAVGESFRWLGKYLKEKPPNKRVITLISKLIIKLLLPHFFLNALKDLRRWYGQQQ